MMKDWIKKLLCFHYWVNDFEWYGNYHQWYKCNKCGKRKIFHVERRPINFIDDSPLSTNEFREIVTEAAKTKSKNIYHIT